MKIAIITFHASENCGSQLQTYALSKVIKEHFGVTPHVIDYSGAPDKPCGKSVRMLTQNCR